MMPRHDGELIHEFFRSRMSVSKKRNMDRMKCAHALMHVFVSPITADLKSRVNSRFPNYCNLLEVMPTWLKSHCMLNVLIDQTWLHGLIEAEP